MLEIIKSHSRFKGLPWYEHLQQVNILGAGGIGSWVALSLARQGHKVLVQDYDRVEPHNLGGQLYSSKSIGKLKVTALTEIIRELCPETKSNFSGSNANITKTNGYIGNITFSCFDNMEARKIAFDRWKAIKNEDNSVKLFIDGRLLAEEYQVLVVDESKIEEYEKTLFLDSQIPDEDCTAKATSHCSMMIAATMTSLFNNYVTNFYSDFPGREVPFLTRVSLPMMTYELKF